MTREPPARDDHDECARCHALSRELSRDPGTRDWLCAECVENERCDRAEYEADEAERRTDEEAA